MQTTYSVRQGDDPASLPLQMVDANNAYAPYDLTGSTVAARMYQVSYFNAPHTGTPVIDNRSCTVTDPVNGRVTMQWQPSDLTTPGNFELDLVVTQGQNRVTTVQSLQVSILAES